MFYILLVRNLLIKLSCADRLEEDSSHLNVLAETDLEVIHQTVKEERPDLLVVDSIQTIYHPEISSAPGSVSQVRESTQSLMNIAKQMNIATFIVGHVTKEGQIAGPRLLEHMVDTVLYFEGDEHHAYRILRAVKNRFGSTNEMGIFEMKQSGLKGVLNPSEMFLEERSTNVPGSTIVPLWKEQDHYSLKSKRLLHQQHLIILDEWLQV